MQIYFKDIFKEIKELYEFSSYENNCNSTAIRQIKFITNDISHFEQSCLYIGKTSQLVNAYDYDSSSFILFKNSDLSHLKISNYILLNNEENLFSVFNLINEILTKYLLIDNPAVNLLDSLAHGNGLKDLINIGSEFIDNPVILLDSSFSVLEYSKNVPISDDIWTRNINRGYCSYEFISYVQKQKELRGSSLNNEPFPFKCIASPYIKYVSKLVIDSRLVGYLVLLECNKKVRPEHLSLLKILNNAIVEELRTNLFYRTTKGNNYENLIYDLLEDNIKDENIALEKMRNSNCNFSKNLFLVTIDLSNYKQVSPNQPLKHYLDNIFINSKFIYYKEDIVILLDSRDNTKNLDSVITQNLDFLRNNNLSIGISDRFSNLTAINKSYNQCKTVINLSKQLNIPGIIFRYNDYKFYSLIDYTANNNPEFTNEYCHSSVLKLLEYDSNNNTDYYKILKVYLQNNQNTNLTSEKLFIHRNTLNYKLTKIKDILGVDLKDSEDIFKIYYSIKLIEYTDSIKSRIS
ncbi:PucR family transcriptional regulator [Clostridium manihotivorum]|nr:helix-turn-helix domain-containing protein [Clostridium manihotivorum]